MSKKKNSGWLFGRKQAKAIEPEVKKDFDQTPVTESDNWLYGSGVTISAQLGTENNKPRDRDEIYQKWSDMESDPVISTALKLHVTAALAGDQESGQAIYIETRTGFESDEHKALIEELQTSLQPLLNEAANTVVYNGVAFGDGYARVYSDKRNGVFQLYTEEQVRPNLIQAFERGGQNAGFIAHAGERAEERLSIKQLARFKMPRLQWVPQNIFVEKNHRFSLLEDDPSKLRIMPATVGGSLLYPAEEPFDKLRKALLGLVGQRWVDALDEEIIAFNTESMTKDQREAYKANLVNMFTQSKALAERSIRSNKPVLERIRHLIPVFNDKQMPQMLGKTSTGTSNITTEDVMMYAKLLAGSLGTDLSMLGFADLLSGGLGEGGFFRTSAQVAENSSQIRKALAEYVNHIINIHTYSKYGIIYKPHERPWQVSFYGSISALENEKQDTRLAAMSSGSALAGVIQQLNDLGFDENQKKTYLMSEMLLDEDKAALYASAKQEANEEDYDSEEGLGQ